jgi:hypothetical protein
MYTQEQNVREDIYSDFLGFIQDERWEDAEEAIEHMREHSEIEAGRMLGELNDNRHG